MAGRVQTIAALLGKSIVASLLTERPPIAIFAYNRADKLEAMLASLQRCNGFADSDVTIFVDGPRRPDDEAAVKAVQNLVANLGLPRVRHVFAPQNRGLRNSIYSGVSAILKERGNVIVLEDDLVLSPIALDYFATFLREYESDLSIWAICGYQYNCPALCQGNRAFKLPYVHPWSWATWSDRWAEFDLDVQPLAAELSSKAFRRRFDLDSFFPFSRLLAMSVSGSISSWYIHWHYLVHSRGGRAIFPPQRMVQNDGLNAGTHATGWNPKNWLLPPAPLATTVPELCGDDAEAAWALARLRNCWEVRLQRLVAWLGDIKRRLRK